MSTHDEDECDERVKITIFTAADSKDSRTTVSLIYSIEVLYGPNAGIYGFAPEHRELRFHEALCKLPVIAGIIRAMKNRGQIRRGILELPAEVYKLYFDKFGNPVFNNDYLEETQQLEKPKPRTPEPAPVKTIPPPAVPQKKSLQSIY